MKRFLFLIALALVAGIVQYSHPSTAQADTIPSILITLITSVQTDVADQNTAPNATWGQVKSIYRGNKPQAYTPEQAEASAARIQKPGATTNGMCPAQCFMWRFPFCGSWQIYNKYGSGYHTGQDLYAIDWNLPGESDLNQPILAPASGMIVWSGDAKNGYGNQVVVDTGNGIFYRVAHLNWLRFSNARQYVLQGQTLGGCGRTGGTSTGSHLHFVVYAGASYLGSGRVSGYSVPQEGINGQWTLNIYAYYPSGQVCRSW